MSGSLKVIFENKTEEVTNSYSKNYKILKKEVSESHPWKDGEAIDFTVVTHKVKQIYLDYDPQYVFFTIEMSAGDPIGYSYNKAIYEVDMKDRWNAIRKKQHVMETKEKNFEQDIATLKVIPIIRVRGGEEGSGKQRIGVDLNVHFSVIERC